MCSTFAKGDNYLSATDVKQTPQSKIGTSPPQNFIRRCCSFSLYLDITKRSQSCLETIALRSLEATTQRQQKSCWSLGHPRFNLISLQTTASGCFSFSFSELLILLLTYQTTFTPGNYLFVILNLWMVSPSSRNAFIYYLVTVPVDGECPHGYRSVGLRAKHHG